MRQALQLISIPALLSLTACSHVSYLWQAGVGQLAIYNHERPLDEVLKDPRTKSEVKERLNWLAEIKKDVEKELEVKATSNYTTYVDLKRPYVIWSLTVAPPYELKLREWAFPVVGSFPYLGFFKEDMAKKWAKEAQDDGNDTYIRGVGAYSTLGYLRDPMLSSMLYRQKTDMVNLIFHETTHGHVYLNDQGSFNEQTASFIGDLGEKVWITKNYGEKSEELKAWYDDREDRRKFGSLLRKFADQLKSRYKETENSPIDAKEKAKNGLFEELHKSLETEKWKGKGWARAGKLIVNNASLLAFLTYEDEQTLFESLEKKCAGSPKAALRFLKQFAARWSDDDGLKKKFASPQRALESETQVTECK